MCRWPGYGFQVFEFRTGYVNQENNVRNRVYNYIKLINSLIQVAINFLERHMDTYRIRVILFSGIQFRTGYQNQANSSLEQGQVSGGPAAHPHQNFYSVPSPPTISTNVIGGKGKQKELFRPSDSLALSCIRPSIYTYIYIYIYIYI